LAMWKRRVEFHGAAVLGGEVGRAGGGPARGGAKGWVWEARAEARKVAGSSVLGKRGPNWWFPEWPASGGARDGRRPCWARARGWALPFIGPEGGGGRAEEGAAGAGREARGGRGLGAWHGGHPRGARRRGKGGVASSGAPEKVGWGNTRGAGAVLGGGATRGAARWPAPAYGVAVGTVQGSWR